MHERLRAVNAASKWPRLLGRTGGIFEHWKLVENGALNVNWSAPAAVNLNNLRLMLQVELLQQ